MRKFSSLMRLVVVGAMLLPLVEAGAQAKDDVCAAKKMLALKPYTELPAELQAPIFEIVRPEMLNMAKMTGAHMEAGYAPRDLKLSAYAVGPAQKGKVIVAVRWEDATFGVNGPVWIVEASANGAKHLVPANVLDTFNHSLPAWGVGILGHEESAHPELMLASKGGRGRDGVAEGVPDCRKFGGGMYQSVPCPAGCGDRLNAK
jgi:hypothetical protein